MIYHVCQEWNYYNTKPAN